MLLGVGAIALVVSMRSASGPSASVPQYYYTNDDGKTYFRDSAERITPFDHDGKPAVRAHVFKAKDGHIFVAWMERNTEKAAAVLRRLRPEGKPPVPASQADIAAMAQGGEYRKVADPKWVPGDGSAMLVSRMLQEIKGQDGLICVELKEEEFPS